MLSVPQLELLSDAFDNLIEQLRAEEQLSPSNSKQKQRSAFGYAFTENGLIPDNQKYLNTKKTRWQMAREVIETFLEVGNIRGTIRRLGERYGYEAVKQRSDFSRSSTGLKDWLLLPTLQGYGFHPQSGQLFPDCHQPLISDAEYLEILRLLEASSRPSNTGKTTIHPLSGLVYCVCGSVCSVGIGGNKQYGEIIYYACDAHRKKQCSDQPANVAKRRSVRADFLEGRVVSLLATKSREIAEKLNGTAATKGILVSELSNYEFTISQVKSAAGGVSSPIIDNAVMQLRDQRDKLLAQLEQMQWLDDEEIQTLIENAHDESFWQSLEAGKKKAMFHWLIERIVVQAEKLVGIALKI